MSSVRPGALQTLKRRGFFKQCTDEAALSHLLDTEPVTFYVGIDPTGTSLHIGHLVPVYAMAHLAAHGHRAIVVVGGGTARIGDPSGKIEMRKLISVDEINANAEKMGRQIDRFLAGSGSRFTMVNNADWLAPLNYIDFLRDIGRHFSVNRMLTFESYRQRMEAGLSFIEFNYQLLQSYDFLVLYQQYGCRLQIGGDDQWGNIVAGADLIRRVEGGEAFGLTFPLVTRADGKKMGKTEKGAVFLDPEQFSPYDFYQYWRNVPDQDVRAFLNLYTFVDPDEIDQLTAGDGAALNAAKERLALETTVLVHGEAVAHEVQESARAVFGGGAGDADAVPSAGIDRAEVNGGMEAIELFSRSDLCASRGEARRLIGQGGARINDRKIDTPDAIVDLSWVSEDRLLLRAGKKRYFAFLVE